MHESSMAPGAQYRLPAFYLSCAEQLPESSPGRPLLGRLLDSGAPPQGVVFITLKSDLVSPVLACTAANKLGARIRRILILQGLEAGMVDQLSPRVQVLQHCLLDQPPATSIELQLCTGLSAEIYRQLGHSLQDLRSEGVLLICLDRTPADWRGADYRSPHDGYWRELMDRWVDEQQWQRAIKLADKNGSQVATVQSSVSNASLCLMHAAFALGGLCQPQRLFGYGLDDQDRALAGLGWMR